MALWVKQTGKTLLLLLVGIGLLSLLLAFTSWAQRDSISSKFETSLAAKIGQAPAEKQFTVILKLKPLPKKAKTNVKVLKFKTAEKQREVLEELKEAKSKGEVKRYRRFWLTNAILVQASAQEIKELAQKPEVVAVFPNFKVHLIEPLTKDRLITTSSTSTSEWNIDKIKASQVWSDFSVNGTDTTVAILDTGIDPDHPDLAGKVSGFVEVDEYGNVSPTEPKDTEIHGTHVAGIVAGGNASGKYIGVAPGTKLMGAIVLPFGFGTFAQVIGGMQWAADPDDNPTTPDQPDVVNMSLGGPPLMAQFYEPVDNLRAAGVFPAIAIGNWGAGWTSSPGDVPTAFGVGATDKNDTVAWFSSGAEVTWYDPPHDGSYIKPDAVAPGVNIKSSIPGGFWLSLSGTSMATPHVAGAAALLRSLKPSLTVDQLGRILQLTAVDLGDAGKDARYGSGRIDVYAAAALANSFGTLAGTVKVAGETTQTTVKLLSGINVVTQALTSKNGSFTIEAAPGNYQLVATKFGYETSTTAVFSLAPDETKTFSFDLPLATRYRLAGKLLNSATGASLDGTVSIVKPTKESTKTVAGSYSFRLPAETYRLKAEAYGFKPQETTITLSADTTLNISLDKVSPTLLVIDWLASSYEPYFTNALNSLGVPYDTLKLDFTNLETAFTTGSFLKQYKKVVWATGDGPLSGALRFNPLTFNKVDNMPLAEYLDSGGKLFLTGQDIGYFLQYWRLNKKASKLQAESGTGDFLADYLHARLIKDKANNLTVSGKPKTVYAGQTYDLLSYGSGEDGADNQFWPDVIDPEEQAVSELTYTKETTGAASLRSYTGKDNSGKVVYLSFGLEGIDKAPDRVAALSKGLQWLDAPAGTISVIPFSNQVTGITPVPVFGQLTPKLAQEKIIIEQKVLAGRGFIPEPPGNPDDWEGLNGGQQPGSPGADETWTWEPVAEATTASDGSWQTLVVPERNTTYRAGWSGNANFSRTLSSTFTIAVKPDIIIEPPRKPVPVSKQAYLSGYLNPLAEAEYRLLTRPLTAKKWRFVKYVFPNEAGELRIPIKPKQHAYYKVVSSATPDFLASSSAAVLVKTRHRLLLKAETNLAPKDVPIIFTGWVYPKHPGRYVKFQLLKNGHWQTLANVKLEDHHWWQTLYAPGQAGIYKFRAVLKKDRRHLRGLSKTVSVRFY